MLVCAGSNGVSTRTPLLLLTACSYAAMFCLCIIVIGTLLDVCSSAPHVDVFCMWCMSAGSKCCNTNHEPSLHRFRHVPMVRLCCAIREASARSPGIKEASHEVLGCTAQLPGCRFVTSTTVHSHGLAVFPASVITTRREPAAGTATLRSGGQMGMHTASMNVQLPSALHDMGGWHIILS